MLSAFLSFTGLFPTYLPVKPRQLWGLVSSTALAIHFFPCFEEVFRVRESHKAIFRLCIFVNNIAEEKTPKNLPFDLAYHE